MGDKVVLEVLIKIGSFCGITPPCGQSKWATTYHYPYSLTISIILLAFSVYSVCNNTYKHAVMSAPEIVLEYFAASLVIMQGTACTLSYLLQPKKWRSFITKIHRNFYNNKEENSRDYIILGIAHCVLIMKATIQWIIFYPIFDMSVNKNYIFRTLYEYNGMIVTCLIIHVNKILTRRFALLNKRLKRSKYSCNYIRSIQSDYKKLVKAIADFNAVFGYQILIVMGNVIVVLVQRFQSALLYKNKDKVYPKNVILIWNVLLLVLVTVKTAFKSFFFVTTCRILGASRCNCNVM